MQGEHHEIEAEFPEFHQRIKDLSANDPGFAASIKRHDELDKEIRKLEELGQPVTDETLEKMKYERSELKDKVYRRNYPHVKTLARAVDTTTQRLCR